MPAISGQGLHGSVGFSVAGQVTLRVSHSRIIQYVSVHERTSCKVGQGSHSLPLDQPRLVSLRSCPTVHSRTPADFDCFNLLIQHTIVDVPALRCALLTSEVLTLWLNLLELAQVS